MATGTNIVLARVQAWNAAHPRQRLDPKAVLAVAAQEGLGGGIGDQGTSFGPWQLHIGGAFPTGVAPRGQEQAWAWSPAGIDYALSRIASVAGGLSGARAVENIVTRFERPANPGGEVSGALSAYGVPPSSGYVPPTGGASRGGGSVSGPAIGQATDPATLALLLLGRQQFTPPPAPSLGSIQNPVIHVDAPSGVTSPHAPELLQAASDYLAATKGAFSNPGFARYLHPAAGLPSTTVGQAAHGAHTRAPAPSDLVFFGKGAPTHQGVSLGSGQFLHATDGGRVLRISNLNAHPYNGSLVASRSIR